MIRSYKYRIYPNKEQTRILNEQLETHRILYNNSLAERKNAWEERTESLSCFRQINRLPQLCQDNVYIKKCNYSSLQQTLRRLDKTYKKFFKEHCGYPRFKSKDRFNTIAYNILGNGCQIKEHKLYLQHVGLIKVKWHRELPCKPKTLSITHRSDKWYVNLMLELPDQELLPKANRVVGIDLGLKSFAITSDGEFIESPKYLRKLEQKLAKAQHKLCRRKKGSNRRAKARKQVANVHEHISNQRKDFCHKESRKLINTYDSIAVEDLQIQNMVKNRHLSKSISDSGWGLFLRYLSYKAESAGRQFVKVDPRNTSQKCSQCGEIVKKSLAVRVHKCPHCGLVLDRDINAAINILKSAWTEPSGDNVEVLNSCVA